MSDFTLLTVEVDGGLRNPYVLGGGVLWTTALTLLGFLAVRSWLARARIRWAYFATFVVLALVTSSGQLLIAEVLYIVAHDGVTSVGFWGTPSGWIAPLVAVLATLAYCGRVVTQR